MCLIKYLLLYVLAVIKVLETRAYYTKYETRKDGSKKVQILKFGGSDETLYLVNPGSEHDRLGLPEKYRTYNVDTDYQYSFKHNERKGHIRVSFEYSYLPKESSIKLYDGYPENDTETVVMQGVDRAVYQSNGQLLSILFKPKLAKKPSDVKYHFGWRAKVSFVDEAETRHSWSKSKSFPGRGYCEQATENSGYIRIVGSTLVENDMSRSYQVDCSWVLRRSLKEDEVKKMIYFRLIEVSLEGGAALLISSGSMTQNTEHHIKPSDKMQLWGSIMHLTLKGHLNQSDVVEFIYAESTQKLDTLETKLSDLRVAHDKKQFCPYKKCATSHGRCLLYWGKCISYEDLSCEATNYNRECKKSKRCYSKIESCDGFDDCPKGDDEKDCTEDWNIIPEDPGGFLSYGHVTIYIIFIVATIGYARYRETIKELFRNLLDCCIGVRHEQPCNCGGTLSECTCTRLTSLGSDLEEATEAEVTSQATSMTNVNVEINVNIHNTRRHSAESSSLDNISISDGVQPGRNRSDTITRRRGSLDEISTSRGPHTGRNFRAHLSIISGGNSATDGTSRSAHDLSAPPPSYEQSSNYPRTPSNREFPTTPPTEAGLEPVPPPSYMEAVSMEEIIPGSGRRPSASVLETRPREEPPAYDSLLSSREPV